MGVDELVSQLGVVGLGGVALLWLTRWLVPRMQEDLKEQRDAFVAKLDAQEDAFLAELKEQRREFREELKAQRDAFLAHLTGVIGGP